jgi:hypothetical protein
MVFPVSVVWSCDSPALPLYNTTSYLKKYIKDFKALVDSSTITQGQIYNYYKRFYKIGIKYKDNSNITKKALIFKFLYKLP